MYREVVLCFFFFFQAEDGIRDLYVTGVQTCALPIYLELMDGTRTVKELVVERFQESGELELTSVADLVGLLHKEGFLTQPYTDSEAAVKRAMNPPPATRRERMNRVAQSMSFEWYGINRFVKWL